MAQTKQIIIDSTRRNRNVDPNPSEFSVVFKNSNIKSALNADDAVSSMSPIRIWTSNLFDQTSIYFLLKIKK